MAKSETSFEKKFPYSYLGVSLRETGKDQYVTDCPFCGKEKHFYIGKETGQYDCKVCSEKGNSFTFLRSFYETLKEEQSTKLVKSEWIKLLSNRGLSEEKLRSKGILFYPEQTEWIVPVYNLQGKIVNFNRFYPALAGKKAKRYAMAGLSHSLGGLETLKKDTEAVWLCEGAWDAFALEELLEEENPKHTDAVFWLPGSGTFKEAWVDVFKDKTVIICTDNDKAGKAAVSQISNILFKAGILEEKLLFIDWTLTGFSKEGFDIRDFYTTQEPLAKLRECIDVVPKEAFVDRIEKTSEILAKFPHITERKLEWTKVVDTLGKNFALSHDLKLGFKVLAANVMSLNIRDSTPNWFHLVAPAGSAKTELISAFGSCKHVYIMSNASSKALVSGFPAKGGADPSLIPRIIGKVLMIKDFTEVLQMGRGDQEELMGILRGAYDGYIVKCFGNGITRQYIDCHFNIVTGVTAVIYGENKASMGERFLKFPMIQGNHFENIDNVLSSAIDQTGREKDIRDELQAKVKEFCEVKFSKEEIPELTEQDRTMLAGLSRVLSFLRAQVDYIPGSEVLAYKPQIEYGTRPMKVMAIQLRTLGMINGEKHEYLPTDEDREIIVKMAVGSMTPYGFDIAKALYEAGEEGLTRKMLAEAIGMVGRSATVNHYLNALENVDFVCNYQGEKDDPSKPGEPPRYFKLTDEAYDLWERSRIQDFILKSPMRSSDMPRQKNRHKDGTKVVKNK